jgi:hypothetical protein
VQDDVLLQQHWVEAEGLELIFAVRGEMHPHLVRGWLILIHWVEEMALTTRHKAF